jgi:arylsulfatase A-like enzyme
MQSESLASQVDLMPTILACAGIRSPGRLQGRDLRVMRGQSDTIFAAATSTEPSKNPNITGIRRAVFSGSLKLVAWTGGSSELYDVASDPEEKRNLYRSDEPRAVHLSRILAEWVAQMPHERAQPATVDPEVMRRLKSLGYAGGSAK